MTAAAFEAAGSKGVSDARATTASLFPFEIKANKPTLGPDGLPIFDGRDLNHQPGTPYFCFEHMTRSSNQASSCHEVQPYCADELKRTKEKGMDILGACKEHKEVTCYTIYRGDTGRTFCFSTREECTKLHAQPIQGDLQSPCTTLDPSWTAPPRG
ncbi:hypothetical protein [Nannocystis bainbridge]|uniref:Uncharacterized protein n=1 Tax=Nannocystis bainbridge TaxID=2995303 RepID=A0ABT5DR41_9BACT|nr:hypothetical protein [Nannocystis bainbridge]MDC0716078.1 hypothetical protein [Nannocystis bainbridge]